MNEHSSRKEKKSRQSRTSYKSRRSIQREPVQRSNQKEQEEGKPATSKDPHHVHFEEDKSVSAGMKAVKRSFKEEEEEKESNPLQLNVQNVLKVAVVEAKDIG